MRKYKWNYKEIKEKCFLWFYAFYKLNLWQSGGSKCYSVKKNLLKFIQKEKKSVKNKKSC